MTPSSWCCIEISVSPPTTIAGRSEEGLQASLNFVGIEVPITRGAEDVPHASVALVMAASEQAQATDPFARTTSATVVAPFLIGDASIDGSKRSDDQRRQRANIDRFQKACLTNP